MRLLLLLAALAAGGYYFFFVRSKADVEVVGEGAAAQLVMHQDGGKAAYAVGEPYEETLMLFGADAGGTQNFRHAWLSGLTTRMAAFLLRQYPQLAKCGAPGSKEAIAALKQLEVVGRAPAQREQLVAAVRLYEQRFKENGDRVCVRLGGHRLTLQSAELDGGIPFQMQKPPDWSSVAANSVEVFDCATILGPS
jgi:hypothetical protein